MLLDFEKPIVLLEEKLALMKEKALQHEAVELKKAIQKLEQDILALKQKTFQNLTRWQRVQLARHTDRPYTLDYIRYITHEFIELHGDRSIADDKAVVGGFGKIDNQTIMLIGHQKGRNIKERQSRNFGMPNPAGYRKALRLMQLAEKFNKPIVTFIDTPGAYPGLEAEKYGQAEAIAKSIQGMFKLRVPIICIVIGEGASGGALAMAIGDRVLMLTNTWYSVISPEACSSILWKSGAYKEQAAEVLKLSAKDMLYFKLIDEIIEEPLGGAHRNIQETANFVKKAIVYHLPLLQEQPIDHLLAERISKFCIQSSIQPV